MLMSPSNNDRGFRPVTDTVVALVAASTPFLDLYFNELSESSGTPFTFATASMFALVIGGPLLVRRRFPFVVLGLLLLGVVLAAATGEKDLPIPFTIAAAVALFTVASIQPRRMAIITSVVSVAIAIPLGLVTTTGTVLSRESLSPIFWSAFAVAAGDALSINWCQAGGGTGRLHAADHSRNP